MKRTLWNITLASLITLVAYIALYAIWGAILNSLKNPSLKSFMIALMTTVAFGFFLLYTSKIRKSVGEEEVIADYKDRSYTSWIDDFKHTLTRESKTLVCVVGIILVCFAINSLSSLLSESRGIPSPTILFAPMCLFGSAIPIPFVGYALSALLDCVAYLVFLLIFRKKKYNYWIKQKE